jgi:hypothetical protein
MWWNNGTNNISSNCPYFLFQLVLPVKPQDHDSNLIRIRKKLNEYRRWLIQWNLCNPTPEFSDILWRPTKIYGAKVFLLTKIKPGYSDTRVFRHPSQIYSPKVFLLTKIKPKYSYILCNPTHFICPLVCWIRQDPLYIFISVICMAKLLLSWTFCNGIIILK